MTFHRILRSKYVILIGIFVIAGCTREPQSRINREDRRAFEHFIASQEADLRAVALMNQGSAFSTVSKERVNAILRAKEEALAEARQVTDALLNKLHPDLRRWYRDYYQRSLELDVEGFREGDSWKTYEALKAHSAFVDWFNTHKSGFSKL